MAVRANIKNKPDMKIEDRYKAEKENEGGNRLDPWYVTEEDTVAAFNSILETYKTEEAIRKYGATKVAAWDNSQTALLKEIAACVVALRRQFPSNKGKFPDWNGATRAYQDAVSKMYLESGIPARHVSGLRNALYYHIQNLVVQVAPKKELEALGMLTTSRRARQATKQSPNNTNTNDAPANTQTAPVVVGGVEAPQEEEKGNQAHYLLLYVRNCLARVLESKDLAKMDRGELADLLEEIRGTINKIGDARSDAADKAAVRRKRSADRRAAAADSATAA